MGVSTYPYITGESNVRNDFCRLSGITGFNDGSIDNTASLQSAINAAVAAGATSIVLPVGDVYLQSSTLNTTDVAYNNVMEYCIRLATDNFSIIIPEGCTVHATQVGDGAGSGNYISAFFVNACTNSGVILRGRIVHDTPGYTSTTPNNYHSAIHLGSTSVSCYAGGGGEVNGFMVPAIGAVDDSSSNLAFIYDLRINGCTKGVVQSSSSATNKCIISKIYVNDAYNIGIQTTSRDCVISDIVVDQSGITPLSGSNGIYIQRYDGCRITNVQCFGADGTSSIGIHLKWTGALNASPVIDGFYVEDYESGIRMEGIPDAVFISNGHLESCTYSIRKNLNTVNCGDTYVKNVRMHGASYGLYGTGTATTTADLTHGNWYLDNVVMTSITSNRYNYNIGDGTNGDCIFVNCNPMPTATGATTIPRPLNVPAGTVFFDSTLAQPRLITFSGTGTTWYDGAGVSV